MFVNISPADYNQDETVTSLTYAARVKEIKNTANKNADSKEVAQLKAIIAKYKAGEEVNEDELNWKTFFSNKNPFGSSHVVVI